MTSASSEDLSKYTDEELREYAMMPARVVLGIDPAEFPQKWEPHGPIWVVPDPALQWGFDNRHHVYAGQTMILPAEEQEWRDNQHYRAYVRPTKEESDAP